MNSNLSYFQLLMPLYSYFILGRYLGSFQPYNVNPFQFVPHNGLESWYSCWSRDGNYFIYSRGFGWISIANFKTASEKMFNDSNIMDLFATNDSEDSLAPDLSTLSHPSRALVADYLTRLIRQRNRPGYVPPAPTSNSPVFKSFPVGSPAAPVLSLDTTLIQLPNRLLSAQSSAQQPSQTSSTSASESEDPLGSIFALIRRASNPLSAKRGRQLALHKEASSAAQAQSQPSNSYTAPLARTVSSPESSPTPPPEPHTRINVFAVGLANGTIRLFNLNTENVQSLATLEHQVPAHPSPAVRAVLFSPADQSLLASAGRDGFVKLWRWTDAIHLSGDCVTMFYY